jgi:type II secretory pathway pseudopilin PulG
MSEGLTIAVVAGIFGILAGVPAAISAAMTSRTRKVAEAQSKYWSVVNQAEAEYRRITGEDYEP